LRARMHYLPPTKEKKKATHRPAFPRPPRERRRGAVRGGHEEKGKARQVHESAQGPRQVSKEKRKRAPGVPGSLPKIPGCKQGRHLFPSRRRGRGRKKEGGRSSIIPINSKATGSVLHARLREEKKGTWMLSSSTSAGRFVLVPEKKEKKRIHAVRPARSGGQTRQWLHPVRTGPGKGEGEKGEATRSAFPFPRRQPILLRAK